MSLYLIDDLDNVKIKRTLIGLNYNKTKTVFF